MNKKLKIALCVLASFVGLLLVIVVCMPEEIRRDYTYEEEQERFEKVLQTAPDEELLLMLRFAIYRGYVPTSDIDPYYDIYARNSYFHRTKRIYDTLCERNPALLRTICSDSEMLREYVYGCGAHFEPRELDTTLMDQWEKADYLRARKLYLIREMLMQRLAPDSLRFDSIDSSYENELFQKYF